MTKSQTTCLRFIMCVTIALCFIHFFHSHFTVSTSEDSAGYFAAGDRILSGHLDYLRTPLYPIICKTSAVFFGDFALQAIALLQYLFHTLSVALLFKAIINFTKNNAISFVSTMLYAVNSVALTWCSSILTESLSLSFSAIYLWMLSKIFTNSNNTTFAAAAPLFLLVMTMLRPFFICFAPTLLLIAAYLYFNRARRPALVASASTATVSVILFLSYCFAFQSQHGHFTTSFVSVINEEQMLTSIHKANHYEELKWFEYRVSDNITLKGWDWEYSNEKLECIHRNLAANHEGTIALRLDQFLGRLFHPQFPKEAMLSSNHILLYFSRNHLAVILVIALIFTLFALSREQRQLSNLIVNLTLLGMVIGPIFTASVGAVDEQIRLSLPSLPAFFAILAILTHKAANLICDNHHSIGHKQ